MAHFRRAAAAAAFLSLCLVSSATGQEPPGRDDDVSPVFGIQRRKGRIVLPVPPVAGFRSIDGSGNNERDPAMGQAGTALRRLAPAAYADGRSALAGADRPGPREVSNAVAAQEDSIPNARGATDWIWQWGQFLDHDLDLTDGVDPPEPANIPIPAGDAFFDPTGTGTQSFRFNRSLYDPATGTTNARQQMNEITAWIDASNVYGSDAERALGLRANDGTGRLRTSAGDLLPFNTTGLPNAGGPSAALFVAGDVRVNETAPLIAVHTLFVREHNRLAGLIRAARPGLTDEQIYQRARRLVGAEMQIITYQEFLPVLLGERALRPYRGYDARVDARIANEFSTAAYRYGHSTLNSKILRLDASGQEIANGHLELRTAFFALDKVVADGIDPILRGLAAQAAQEVDPFLIDDVRNFLFGPPGAGGFDLASLNIQRGRDHGVPSYNQMRRAIGLSPVTRFEEISTDPEVVGRLASVYANVDQIDLWVGGLSEDHVPGSMLGPTVRTILVRQFSALRDGDRYWWERSLSADERRLVEGVRLSDVIRRNTGVRSELPENVFRIY